VNGANSPFFNLSGSMSIILIENQLPAPLFTWDKHSRKIFYFSSIGNVLTGT